MYMLLLPIQEYKYFGPAIQQIVLHSLFYKIIKLCSIGTQVLTWIAEQGLPEFKEGIILKGRASP